MQIAGVLIQAICRWRSADMSRALSVDLRIRVLAAVDGGASHREAAERFGVSAASVSRWRNLQLRQGSVRPGPLGGDRSSHKIEAHADLIMAWLAEHRDGTLFELRDALSAEASLRASLLCTGFWFGTSRRAKKDWACGRAKPSRHPGKAAMLVRGPARSRPRAAPVHRRDLDGNQYGPHSWTMPQG